MTWFHHLEDTCRLSQNCMDLAGVGLFVMLVTGFLIAGLIVRLLYYGVFAVAFAIWLAFIGTIGFIFTMVIYYPLKYTKWLWMPLGKALVFLYLLSMKITAFAIIAGIIAYFAGYGYILDSMYQSVARIF
jgi:hypothetical protein